MSLQSRLFDVRYHFHRYFAGSNRKGLNASGRSSAQPRLRVGSLSLVVVTTHVRERDASGRERVCLSTTSGCGRAFDSSTSVVSSTLQ
eukprot:6110261-Amphidinium_carterae.1